MTILDILFLLHLSSMIFLAVHYKLKMKEKKQLFLKKKLSTGFPLYNVVWK